MAKRWIQKAIKHPGALKRAAKAAGMSIDQYCSREDLDTTAKRRCALYHTLRKLAKRKK